MEGGRAVSTARAEAGSLARALQDERDSHRQEARSLETQVKHCLAEEAKRSRDAQRETTVALERAEMLREKVEKEAGEQAGKLVRMEEEMSRRAMEANRQVAEAQLSASETVASAARLQVEAAYNMAVSVATAATREAVTVALAREREERSAVSSDTRSSGKEGCSSEFESSVQRDSLGEREEEEEEEVDGEEEEEEEIGEEEEEEEETIHTSSVVEDEQTPNTSQLMPTSHDSSATPVPSAMERGERDGESQGESEEGGGGGGEGGGDSGEEWKEECETSESHTSVPLEESHLEQDEVCLCSSVCVCVRACAWLCGSLCY